MNVVTQLTQFVGHYVINKTRLTWLYAVQLGQLSSVELCRYKHPFNDNGKHGFHPSTVSEKSHPKPHVGRNVVFTARRYA